MLFLGTAAAESFPNPFCECDVCKMARASKDPREIRSRSSFLLDEENLIDFNADVLSAANRYGVCFSKIKNIFITHMHEDHFDYWNMEYPNMSVTPLKPFTIYGSPAAIQGLQQVVIHLRSIPYQRMRAQLIHMEDVFTWKALPFFETCIIDKMQVTALRGRHEGFFDGENSANYHYVLHDQSLLYATDTGRFFQETYEWLAGKHIDILIVEGTFGIHPLTPASGHMDVYALCDTIKTLYEMNVLSPFSHVYVTHIGHKGKLNHVAYETLLQKQFGTHVHIAYDGLHL